jgi:NAD(P)-dependent dehydrogenase (short-subunit alcohol dehydrogenase family)
MNANIVGRLEGKSAIVTGAASGIGRKTAILFAAEGAKVLAADLSADGLEKLKTEINQAGGVCETHVTDVTKKLSIASLFERSDLLFSELNIVVNNAGITIVGGVHEISEEDWDLEMNVNVKSIYLMSREAWPRLIKSTSATILNTASIAGTWAIMSDAAYCASKAAVIMLTKCMGLDGAKDGIRVNCVAPGFIDTPMIHRFFSDQTDAAAARAGAIAQHPLGRLGSPSDIAGGFLYLASEDAAWVTGTVLTVDGGLTSGLWDAGN